MYSQVYTFHRPSRPAPHNAFNNVIVVDILFIDAIYPICPDFLMQQYMPLRLSQNNLTYFYFWCQKSTMWYRSFYQVEKGCTLKMLFLHTRKK